MSDFQVVNVGEPNQWREYFGGFRPETSRDGRRVVERELNNEFIGLTVNALEPGEEAGYWHTHTQIEELYFFVSGEGQMALDDQIIDVEAGTIVRVGLNVARTWRAKKESPGQLQYLCIRAGGSRLPYMPDDAERDTATASPW